MKISFGLKPSFDELARYYGAGCFAYQGIAIAEGVGNCMPSQWRLGVRLEAVDCEPARALLCAGHDGDYSRDPDLAHVGQNRQRFAGGCLAACPSNLAELGQGWSCEGSEALKHMPGGGRLDKVSDEEVPNYCWFDSPR